MSTLVKVKQTSPSAVTVTARRLTYTSMVRRSWQSSRGSVSPVSFSIAAAVEVGNIVRLTVTMSAEEFLTSGDNGQAE